MIQKFGNWGIKLWFLKLSILIKKKPENPNYTIISSHFNVFIEFIIIFLTHFSNFPRLFFQSVFWHFSLIFDVLMKLLITLRHSLSRYTIFCECLLIYYWCEYIKCFLIILLFLKYLASFVCFLFNFSSRWILFKASFQKYEIYMNLSSK